MVRLSERAINIISELEFNKNYYFTRKDIKRFFDNDKQLTNFIYNQRKNKRIIKLNKYKYFLIPIKARSKVWTDNPLIVADELMNSKNYYVGGWYAAKYWSLTDQIPMQIDIFSPNKFGKAKILNKRYVFHRIRKEALTKAILQEIEGHTFFILSKDETKKWLLKN